MKSLRYITDAAMTTALVVVILLISHYTGAEIEEMFPFLLPIPLALYVMRYDWKKGLIPFFAITAISLIHNPLHGLFFVAFGNVIGLLYGAFLYHHVKKAWRLLIAVVGSFFINFLSLWVFSKLLYGYTIYEDLQRAVASLFSHLSIDNTSLQSLMEAVVKGLVPSILFLFSLLEGFLFHFLTSILSFRIFHHETDIEQHGFHLRVHPVLTILYLPICILSFVFLTSFPNMTEFWKYIWMIGMNLTLIGGFFYIIESLLFFSLLARQFHKPWIYILSCLGILLFPIHWLIGIVDSFYPLHLLLLRFH